MSTTANQNKGFNLLFNSSKSSLNFEKILSGIGSVFFFKFISENNNFVLCALWIVYAVIIYATVAEIKKFNQTKFTIYCCSAWFFLLAFLFLFTDFSVVKNIGSKPIFNVISNRRGTGNSSGNNSSNDSGSSRVRSGDSSSSEFGSGNAFASSRGSDSTISSEFGSGDSSSSEFGSGSEFGTGNSSSSVRSGNNNNNNNNNNSSNSSVATP
jgi:hypothetical protein